MAKPLDATDYIKATQKKRPTTMKGRFLPKNPQKYIGNPNQIFFRSSWELHFFKYLDQNNAVVRWASEELAIPYVHPYDRRVHKYYPDVLVWYIGPDGNIQKEIFEIKPFKETVRTAKSSERDIALLTINEAKWAAAKDFAAKNGAKFSVLTEKSMFMRGAKKKAIGRAT